MNEQNQWQILKKVLLRVRRHLWKIAASLVLATGYVAMSLRIPILVGEAVDQIVGPGNVDFAAVAAILSRILLCAALGAVSQWLMQEMNNRTVYRVTQQIREEAFRHLQRLPLSYLDSHPQGDIVSRVVADVDSFADGLLMGFTQFFTGITTILGTLGLMLAIRWQIALVVVAITPVSLLVAKFIAQRTYDLFREQTAAQGAQTALINETVGGLKTVQAFSHEEATLADFDKINTRLEKSALKAIFYSSITNPSTRFVNALVYAGVGLTGALSAMTGGITVGNLTSFLSYANQYTKPFNEISGVVAELQNSLACAGRVFQLIEAPAMDPDPQEPAHPKKFTGGVEIQDLEFSYTPEKPLIRDFSLSVRPGQRVAIVGPTGCGKTTFINLLMRFYDPQGGRILLDGVDTQTMSRRALRRSVGMVLQDTWLQSGTVAENIAMGKPEATRAEIIAAAKQAHAHGFIRRLPQGYDTPIGESGGALSQGQKQLLCIARVMLCLPPMLFLDEATSSIDTRTELQVQRAFDAMMAGRTSFIVAHRLSTIREADIILVMKDGQIIEQGRHEELLRKGGFYFELYNSQFAH